MKGILVQIISTQKVWQILRVKLMKNERISNTCRLKPLRGAAGAGTLLSAQFAVQNLRFEVGKAIVLDEVGFHPAVYRSFSHSDDPIG